MALSSGKPWAIRIVLIALALLCLATLAGASHQAIAWRADDQRLRRPGRLVSAGKLRLNLYCTGRGVPTVVLEAGLADSLDTWRRVQPEIARFARACSYDRAGYGYSDPGPIPRTSERIAVIAGCLATTTEAAIVANALRAFLESRVMGGSARLAQ